jgi:hypothetical protein
LATSLARGPQVTDSHFAAHTDPVVAFTDDDATAAHSHLHPNASAFTYRHGNPDHCCHTDCRTHRYAYCHRHSVSHRHAHSNALAHPYGLIHCPTDRHSHGYGHGYGNAYRNQFTDRYPHSHALRHEPTY